MKPVLSAWNLAAWVVMLTFVLAGPATAGQGRGGGGGGGRHGGGQTSGHAATPSGPASTRTPNGGTVVGQSTPRAAGATGGTAVAIPNGYYGGFYPWGFGGYGFGGYDSGYYDPWFYGSYGYPQTSYGYGYGGGGDASLRLKVKPSTAAVYVDGFYTGIVDDFDGAFQRLHVQPGDHKIEIRADGYEPIDFDIRSEPGRTITYRGNLQKEQ